MADSEIRKKQANREVWLNAALEVLNERGVDGIKVVTLAKRLGLTSGSFYWHFKNLPDLLDGMLAHWEHHLTDHIMKSALQFSGSSEDRILNLMLQVIREDAAVADNAISVWAKHYAEAHIVFHRTIEKRMEYATWMFVQADFSSQEAIARGRLMVTSLMGESTTNLKTYPDWEETVRTQWRVFMAR